MVTTLLVISLCSRSSFPRRNRVILLRRLLIRDVVDSRTFCWLRYQMAVLDPSRNRNRLIRRVEEWNWNGIAMNWDDGCSQRMYSIGLLSDCTPFHQTLGWSDRPRLHCRDLASGPHLSVGWNGDRLYRVNRNRARVPTRRFLLWRQQLD